MKQYPAMAGVMQRLSVHAIENLPPAYFSLVMATGIVSIACDLLGMRSIALALFVINIVAFVSLWLLTLLRLVLFRQRLLADLKTHALCPGYFTIVAGTCVLGIQFVSLVGADGIGLWLWILAGLLWLLITYAVFTAIITRPQKPSLAKGLNGAWLIAAVATHAVSILGALIAFRFEAYQETILFLALVLYLMGCMLYLNIIAIIFLRLTFVDLEPADLTPPYWINMGATAITTQAGSTLILNSWQSPLLAELVPYLKGFTLFFWAAGTWWIPLLIALLIWTYLVRRVPLNYSPQFWGAVFPMGMYTASTYQFARATESDFLLVIPQVSVYVALLAWALTFTGLVRQLIKGVIPLQGEVSRG